MLQNVTIVPPVNQNTVNCKQVVYKRMFNNVTVVQPVNQTGAPL